MISSFRGALQYRCYMSGPLKRKFTKRRRPLSFLHTTSLLISVNIPYPHSQRTTDTQHCSLISSLLQIQLHLNISETFTQSLLVVESQEEHQHSFQWKKKKKKEKQQQQPDEQEYFLDAISSTIYTQEIWQNRLAQPRRVIKLNRRYL